VASWTPLRDHLVGLLEWEDAHTSFDSAVANLPGRLRGQQPAGLPYSPWSLVEHLRITQHDILDFCVNPKYQELRWPDDYWPQSPMPGSGAAWDDSIKQFQRDRDPKLDLESRIPHGQGQTYLRELLLAADHAAYHVGELIVVRRLLNAWP
jgi:hypothetical protein